MQPNFDAIYRALVTSVYDPTNSGRIKVQCPQLAGLVEIRSAEPANPQDPIPSTGTTVWLAFSGGDITKPVYFTNDSFITNPDGFLIIKSPPNGTDQLYVTFNSGANPYLLINDTNDTSSVNVYISGAVIKTSDTGTAHTWQIPSLATGYTNISSQYRFDMQDNVMWVGELSQNTGVGSANSAVVFTLSGSYIPAHTYSVPCTWRSSANVLKGSGAFIFQNDGAVVLEWPAATANGDKFSLSTYIPLGNIS